MTQSISTQRPLAGYRVVDFGQYIAGPAVAMMLADQGAEVIHIDPLKALAGIIRLMQF
ncbi:CoA transferase [Aliamphritea spongicola]|nr:CoA transferase [Aliamphritea spongicola]